MSHSSHLTTKTIALCTLVTMSTTGCYSTWDLTPEGALNLGGFRSSEPRTIAAADGERVIISGETELRFQGVDNLEVKLQAGTIDVNQDILTASELNSGQPVHVDLRRMRVVQVTNFSSGKTALAVVGFVAGGAAAIPVGYALAIAGFLAIGGGFGGGRPLRVAGKASPVRAAMRLAHARERAQRARVRGGDEATRAQIAAHWAKEASAECASVPAFLALARDLASMSAPTALVRAVLAAAREEVHHTRLTTELSHAHSDLPLLATMPRTPVSVDIDRASLLKRLALEAFWDGCVAEGAAASVAERSLVTAKDATTHAALQIIARDEQQHAQLSKDILAYCLDAGGKGVRDAIAESLVQRSAAEETSLGLCEDKTDGPAIDEDLASVHGLAQRSVVQAARIEAWERAVHGLRVASA